MTNTEQVEKVKQIILMKSTHSPHVEEEEGYMRIVGEFLIED